MLSEIIKSQTVARLRAATCLLIAALMITGCTRDVPNPGDTLPASTVNEDALPGLAHIHDLGVNPSDGDLYAATHFGLWRVTTEKAERVGDSAHDFMGFTIAGDDRFLASGHPQGVRDLPPHLGLIESTDGGQSWTSRSLMGEADFHILRKGVKRVYGWSSTTGTLATTDDMRSWNELGSISMLDLAIDPEDDRRVVAGIARSETRIELQVSDDSGATWSPLDDAPELIRMHWSKQWLWGVTTDGDVWKSRTPESSWSKVGAVGADVEAITADAGTWYAAADGAIRTSRNDGESWDVLLDY